MSLPYSDSKAGSPMPYELRVAVVKAVGAENKLSPRLQSLFKMPKSLAKTAWDFMLEITTEYKHMLVCSAPENVKDLHHVFDLLKESIAKADGQTWEGLTGELTDFVEGFGQSTKAIADAYGWAGVGTTSNLCILYFVFKLVLHINTFSETREQRFLCTMHSIHMHRKDDFRISWT